MKSKTFLYAALIQAIIATSGSLYFSEIAHFPPCVLCWYQRIFMYPQVVILVVGILKKDKWLPYYVLPLTLVGLGISIYHNLLYYKIIPEALAPCINGVSCTTKFIEWFGLITIPFLSMCSFIIIVACMLFYLKFQKNDSRS
jgi:disulfide bond formation protein DsbB